MRRLVLMAVNACLLLSIQAGFGQAQLPIPMQKSVDGFPPAPLSSLVVRRRGGLLLGDSALRKHQKIIGLEVHLAGAFESIWNVPPGWQLMIDNQPSRKAVIVGRALPGVPPINESTLRAIDLQVVEDEVPSELLKVWGWVTILTQEGAQKRLPISSYGFDFVDRYPRTALKMTRP